MKIAVNALSVQGGGGLTFLKNLLHHLLLIDKKNEYLVLVVEEKARELGIRDPYPNLRTLIYPSREWIARGMWEQMMLPWVLRREKVDILYAPGNQGPVLFCCPFVVFIQNVDPLIRGFRGYPLRFLLKREISRFLMCASVWRARKVIAVSEYARQLTSHAFGYPLEKIAMVHHGSPKDGAMLQDGGASLLESTEPSKPYLLAVSTIKENKNYENLLEAFAIVCSEISQPVKLLIAGEIEDKTCFLRIKNHVDRNRLSSRVVFLGKVEGAALRALYVGSEGLVFPSKIESFGLPPLEAMVYGVPVAASRIEPIVEVCGAAVLYFDPENCQEMAKSMVRLLKDGELKKTLVERGRARAKLFSWERAARRTLEVLQAAFSG